MKASLLFTLLLAFSGVCAFAFTIVPWPPGTILYRATAVTLTYVSPKYFDKETSEDRITVKLDGVWELNPQLQGVIVSPQAGVIIGADTDNRRRELEKLVSLCSSLKGKKVDVYIYAGAVNKDQATYAWPEHIKIVLH